MAGDRDTKPAANAARLMFGCLATWQISRWALAHGFYSI